MFNFLSHAIMREVFVYVDVYEYLHLHIPLTQHWHVVSRSKSNLQPTITLSLVYLLMF